MLQKHKSTAVRKQEIVNAARKLIIKYGSEHVTVRNLAREVKISEAAIYRHFKSKREILYFLADQVTDNLHDDMKKADEDTPPSLETVDRVLQRHLSRIEQRRGMSFQVIAEIISFGDKKLNKRISENINTYVGQLQKLLSRGVSLGMIREDVDLGEAAFLLFGMIQGLVNMWALSNYDFDLLERYQSLWGIFKRAIVKHEESSPPQ